MPGCLTQLALEETGERIKDKVINLVVGEF